MMLHRQISKEAGFGRSLFERLVNLGYKTHLLDIQYRMHPSISKFPNTEFYGNRISDAENVKEKSHNRRFLNHRMYVNYSFINIAHGQEEFDKSRSLRNLVEVSVVANIVTRLSNGIFPINCLIQYIFFLRKIFPVYLIPENSFSIVWLIPYIEQIFYFFISVFY